jgi:membrane fusion protein (multidrug efflux system)
VIVQNSPLKLRVDIPETAANNVRVGGTVEFTVDSHPGRTFEGKISRQAPSVDQQSRTLKVEAIVSNPDGTLKPGSFARVRIKSDRREVALVAPRAALFTFAGLEKVFVIENGRVAERIVRSGLQMQDVVEIIEGVKEGDLVATSNLGNLQHGREVTVR